MSSRSTRSLTIWLPGALLLLAACASEPPSYEAPPQSWALENATATTAHQIFAEAVEARHQSSGFLLLPSSETTFVTRDAMLAVAEHTIDAQYFTWESDQTGLLMVDRIIRAADRGVRVRLLLDDIDLIGRDDNLAHLDNLPNVEVRIFNPFEVRGTRLFDFLGDFSRANHRMHNKAMIVDNALAVVGGRNIGNHYFGVDTVFNYRDLDVLAVGPIVPRLSHAFDTYWNSEWAVPMAVIAEASPPLDETRQRQRDLHAWAEAGADDYPYNRMSGREVLIEAAYFVPDERSIGVFRDLAERGVTVRVPTNSLASIDMVPAYGDYAEFREPLLRFGVELHELKADVEQARKYWSLVALKSRATLHTKTGVFDREMIFVGSFNSDPRSRRINTEFGLPIHDQL